MLSGKTVPHRYVIVHVVAALRYSRRPRCRIETYYSLLKYSSKRGSACVTDLAAIGFREKIDSHVRIGFVC
jgi:hypothetical protein